MNPDYPATYHAANPEDGGRRPRLFDPALKPCSHAFRPGDPTFDRPEDAECWTAARRRATDHVLRRVAESPWGDRLALRGSRLLKAWLGDLAREPGDLDFVVISPGVKATDPWAMSMLAGLASIMSDEPGPSGIQFLHDKVATDEIWTYERAEGRRIVFPWRVLGLPGGSVQVDIVFSEDLSDPPVLMPVTLADGAPANIWVAGPGQSLAWKLLWLETDAHPQGKDLYDAVILAEHVFLPRVILDQTLKAAGAALFTNPRELVDRWYVDWENFQAECPWVGGTLPEWLARLAMALKPSFTLCRQPTRSVLFAPQWKTWEAVSLARGIVEGHAFARLPILADALEEAGCEDADVLSHCRAGQPHGRDCWVIEALIVGEKPETP